MRYDFFPSRDDDIPSWSKNLSDRIAASPEAYSLTQQDADHFAQLCAAFVEALKANSVPGTRCRVSSLRKNEAKAALETEARRLSRIIKAAPGVTDPQRIQLGLSVRSGGGKQPLIQAPATRPVLSVVSVVQRRVTIRISDLESPRRARPRGVIGAAIYSYVSEGDPPAELAKWHLQGYATGQKFVASFDASVPAGAKVWLAGHWLSTRLKIGPLSHEVYTNIPGGNAPVIVPLRVLGQAA